MEKVLRESKTEIRTVIPYGEMAYLDQIHRYGQILSEEYVQDGVEIHAYVPSSLVR